MSEKQLQAAIIEMARLFGWTCAHFRTAMNKRGAHMTPVAADGAGFPDLLLVRERIVFAEVKVGKNRLSEYQVAWRDKILAAGGEWYEWREQDWQSGGVDNVLR